MPRRNLGIWRRTMQLAELEERVDRSISLSPAIWAKAALLGEARRLSNKGRGRAADRGAAGNQAVDLNGALGELVLLAIAERASALEAARQMAAHMFHPDGGQGVEGPDLIVAGLGGGGKQGVDAKTFDGKPSKRCFAINGSKHAILRGYCEWYFALIVPPLGRRAELARLVPHADVERWPTAMLRAGKGLSGSPSRNLPIGTFISRYLSRPIDLARLRSQTCEAVEVERLANDEKARAELLSWLPETERYLQGRHVATRAAGGRRQADA